MTKRLLLLLVGGALGTLSRYWTTGYVYAIADGRFPTGTLVVNLLGSFVIGLLWALAAWVQISSPIRSFVFIGFLGGFTTFSTYMLETMNLLRAGEWVPAFLYVFGSTLGGLLMVVGGFVIGNLVVVAIR